MFVEKVERHDNSIRYSSRRSHLVDMLLMRIYKRKTATVWLNAPRLRGRAVAFAAGKSGETCWQRARCAAIGRLKSLNNPRR